MAEQGPVRAPEWDVEGDSEEASEVDCLLYQSESYAGREVGLGFALEQALLSPSGHSPASSADPGQATQVLLGSGSGLTELLPPLVW